MDFPNFFPTTITLQYFMFHRVLLRCAEVEVYPTQVDITMEVYAVLKAIYIQGISFTYSRKGKFIDEQTKIKFHL